MSTQRATMCTLTSMQRMTMRTVKNLWWTAIRTTMQLMTIRTATHMHPMVILTSMHLMVIRTLTPIELKLCFTNHEADLRQPFLLGSRLFNNEFLYIADAICTVLCYPSRLVFE